MLLYSIRRLSDGKFFVGTNAKGDLNMNSSPVFWKTPGSIWDNLKRICSKYAPYADKWGFLQKDWNGFDPKKLAEWEVIVTNVKILGQKGIPASKFVDKSALRKRDVRIKKLPRAA